MIGRFLSRLVTVSYVNNNLLTGRLHCSDWVQPCRLKGSSTSCWFDSCDSAVALQNNSSWRRSCDQLLPPHGYFHWNSLTDWRSHHVSSAGEQLVSSLKIGLSTSELFRRRGNFFFTFIISAHADSVYFSSTAAFSGDRIFVPILVWLNLFALSKLKLAIFKIF